MESEQAVAEPTRAWPLHGWIGLGFVLIFWILNWSLPGLRTHWAFFPLWLGYCLTVDALVYVRKGTSLLIRSPRAYVALFVMSAPVWWLFEVLNWRTQNWHYAGRELFTNLQYFLLASLSFSTVMPAVFGTGELAGTFGWLQRLAVRTGRVLPRVAPTRRTLLLFFALGWALLAALLIWPLYFFWALWLALFFILEPINVWLGHRDILRSTARRDWQPVLALWVGVWICAFFWEMWNFYAYPKWIYTVPWVGFVHVFEMPILGYLGYLPFALELFTLFHLVTGLLLPGWKTSYIRLADGEMS